MMMEKKRPWMSFTSAIGRLYRQQIERKQERSAPASAYLYQFMVRKADMIAIGTEHIQQHMHI